VRSLPEDGSRVGLRKVVFHPKILFQQIVITQQLVELVYGMSLTFEGREVIGLKSFCSYRAVNSFLLGYKNQSVNAV
jgi:hypothetical protein